MQATQNFVKDMQYFAVVNFTAFESNHTADTGLSSFNHAIWPIKMWHSHSLCSKIEFVRHLTYARLFWSSQSALLYFLHSRHQFMVQFPVIAWELHRDGIIMVIVWLQFSKGHLWWHLLNPHLNNFHLYPPLHLSLLPPSPSTTPSPP